MDTTSPPDRDAENAGKGASGTPAAQRVAAAVICVGLIAGIFIGMLRGYATGPTIAVVFGLAALFFAGLTRWPEHVSVLAIACLALGWFRIPIAQMSIFLVLAPVFIYGCGLATGDPILHSVSKRPRRPHWLMGAAAILVFLVWRYHSPMDSYVPILDNLDDNLPKIKLMVGYPFFLPNDYPIPELMGGLPRGSLYSDFGLYILPFRFLEPIHAYILNELVYRSVAFAGMLLLLSRYATPNAPPILVTGVSAAFALQPFWPAGFWSVSGLPLLLVAVLNIRRERPSWANWLYIALFPFASLLVSVGIWLIAALGVLWLRDWIVNRKLPLKLGIVIVLLSSLYLLVEYRVLVDIFVGGGVPSQRLEFGAGFFSNSRTPQELFDFMRKEFLFGYYHVRAVQMPILFPLLLLGMVASGLGWLFGRSRRSPETGSALRETPGAPPGGAPRRTFVLISVALTVLLLTSLVYGLDTYYPFKNWLFQRELGVLRTLHLRRLSWFQPPLWYLGFAVALAYLVRLRALRLLVPAALALQLTFASGTVDYDSRARIAHLSYREFFSPSLFGDIKDHIGRPTHDYRVISIGMHPLIALYNGFHCADGYVPSYPLSYKHRFRNLIEHELEGNRVIRNVFDQWGGRCYAFSAELGFHPYKVFLMTRDSVPRVLRRFELNPEALDDLGIEYVLSALEILEPQKSGLEPDAIFTNPDSPWEIHLYKRARDAAP